MPNYKPITLRMIAKELNLTIQTVSKALNERPGMSETTRQLIVQTAERLPRKDSATLRMSKFAA